MFGKIELEKFEVEKLPQKAASAWSGAFEKGFVGAEYKPIKYCGTKQVRGVNYCFIAEQTISSAAFDRELVSLQINEFNGEYTLVPTSIHKLNWDS